MNLEIELSPFTTLGMRSEGILSKWAKNAKQA